MKARWRYCIMVGVLGLAVAGCAKDQSTGIPLDSDGFVASSSYPRFPTNDLQDLATFSDHLVIADVVAEEQLVPLEENLASGEGYVGRRATVSVRDILWSGVDTAGKPLAAPRGSLTFLVDGWVMHDGEMYPDRSLGSDRIEVGGTYLIPLVLREGAHEPVGVSQVVELTSEGAPLPRDEDSDRPSFGSEKLLAGLAPSEAAALLATTPMHEGTSREMAVSDRLLVAYPPPTDEPVPAGELG